MKHRQQGLKHLFTQLSVEQLSCAELLSWFQRSALTDLRTSFEKVLNSIRQAFTAITFDNFYDFFFYVCNTLES